ncbi:GTPase [Anabaena catenula]|uniref:50S ribosome-binding GTPase n=1 Tax=Anabaena catenula FACHB-362 TaxID=2692877 RepID=A0ABR8IYG7_9NOST|nr:GTPase [Anabaena catenula]MBD2690335.1 50S ribosome-binding GTPase [Anabaena catenula FACHB-362]
MNIDLDAIAHHLNQSLSLNGIIGVTAKVSVNHDCLKVILVSQKTKEITDRGELLQFTITSLRDLKLTTIQTVKIHGQQINSFDLDWSYKYKYGLSSENNSNYSQDNQTKHQIKKQNTTSNNPVKRGQIKVSQDEFEEALKKCSKMANSAYYISIRYAKKIEIAIKNFNSNIEAISHEILKIKGSEQFQFATELEQIQLDIQKLSEDSLEDLVISLNQKRKHLENFTVALFGRTKAGKSTLRETLTRGSGSTIGKGSQRTTRDVTEYSWQGLRLLDTPGIEAYKGDDDTQKANKIIDQSDIILFLTSDDSVQPGEFQAMAQLQQINKYFAVILNVKYDISNKLEDLKMILDMPEIVFDEDRLSQQKNHIQSHIKEYLNLDNVDIVPIHAQAGFLSTQAEYQEYSSQLWELSKIEELYALIAYQIYTNGQKLRLATFSESLDYFIVLINQKLAVAKSQLSVQLKVMEQKQRKIEKIFTEVEKDGNKKIKDRCDSLYDLIENEIGKFVDNYSDKDINGRQREWKRIVNEKHIEETMTSCIDEIFSDLREKLQEFEQEYEYDIKNIQIDMEMNFSNITKDDTGKLIKRVGVGIGAVGAALFVAANWWNPGGWVVGAGIVTTVASIGTSVAGDREKADDDKNYKKDIAKEKDSLKKQVKQKREITIKAYQDSFSENIIEYEIKVVSQMKIYIQGLWEIIQKLDDSCHEIAEINKQMQEDFDKLK